jgi:hypothetical protein
MCKVLGSIPSTERKEGREEEKEGRRNEGKKGGREEGIENI